MDVNVYVLEKLVHVRLSERRAEAARFAVIKAATAESARERAVTMKDTARTPGWIELQFGR